MANEADEANELNQIHSDKAIDKARQAAAEMPVGYSGECIHCEELFTRIVNGHCGKCRDLLGLN